MRQSDGAGGFSETWTALGVIWGEVSAGAGRKSSQGSAPLSAVSWKITVRNAPIDHPERPIPEQRLRDGNRIFNIHAVAERDLEGRYLTCFANEEVVT